MGVIGPELTHLQWYHSPLTEDPQSTKVFSLEQDMHTKLEASFPPPVFDMASFSEKACVALATNHRKDSEIGR